jgi:hypothetical protein
MTHLTKVGFLGGCPGIAEKEQKCLTQIGRAGIGRAGIFFDLYEAQLVGNGRIA